MGFHVCEHCQAEGVAPEHSSGDVTLAFASGHVWRCPDMILHFCLEHRYAPPAAFVADVMGSELVAGNKNRAEPVGYLEGSFPQTDQVRGDFCRALARVLRQARAQGDRQQTRGL